MNNDVSLKIGTASGTLLSLVPNILSEDIARTVVLAVLGAVVSFAVTVLLKWFTRSKKK
jgi:H+/Cl- antiporter ClcA